MKVAELLRALKGVDRQMEVVLTVRGTVGDAYQARPIKHSTRGKVLLIEDVTG